MAPPDMNDHKEIYLQIHQYHIEEDTNGDGELRRGLNQGVALSPSECVQARPQKPGHTAAQAV